MATSIDVIQNIGNNREYLNGLAEQLRTGAGVTPFVGAGMSAQLQLLDWGEFLISIGRRFYAEEPVKELVAAGKYEEAAEVCIEKSGPGGLQHAITEEFGDKRLDQCKKIAGALPLLPEIANGPVLTTNFDHVLERTFSSAKKGFTQVLWGDSAASMIESFHKNLRYLFKIHGDVDRPEQRILTRQEYDRHYGEVGKAENHELPLHGVIDIAMKTRPLLFLGCSLKSDRIVAFLQEFYTDYQRLMHYAIVWRPDDEESFRRRGEELTRLGLKPIWYRAGDYDSVALILEYALVRAGRIRPPKNKALPKATGPTLVHEALREQKYAELAALGAAPKLGRLYELEAAAIARGELAFFLGWGVHLGRDRGPEDPLTWREASQRLAEQIEYDEPIGSVTDFTRLTQYIYDTAGEIKFDEYMRDFLGRPYPPTLAHFFIAGLPGVLRSKRYTGIAPLILTTNQDDVLERSFEQFGEPLDTLSYIGRGANQGYFFYRPASGPAAILRGGKQVARVTAGERPLLLKLHGGVDRLDPDAEKMVLTEEDHLSYLARLSVSDLLPPIVKQRLIRSQILFIGYALRDWTIRVLLKRIWAEQRPRKVSYAILLGATKVTQQLMLKQGVEVVDQRWEHVLAGLVMAVSALPNAVLQSTVSPS